MKKFAVAMLAGLMMLSFQFTQSKNKRVYAETLDQVEIYTVQKGDTLFDIGLKKGVSELELRNINHIKSNKPHSGQKLILPKTISKAEKELLARLVHAEAKGEPYKGKVAVALVVLNRVEDHRFPDNIKDVIYQKRQFQPVDNGSINDAADHDSKKAVMEALALEGQDNDSVYFFNPDKTNSKWLRSRTVTTVIGNHRFAK
ncbi:LysM peptidoglycan-binding domain-containing protein [Cytobacillus depressus]|uniref:LysM peptidoglycan-binding domain-containing protein n=2 Tax=Cytobacillus depressus TaxID=1602942 RepID=A0A6L3V8E8_9BACI|nr:cell wall hydrolase [Cytobacillus depressus]KAB2337722.1 LysM peptidoglycan-binding domain-containing protein [Cytobacillus depressus]